MSNSWPSGVPETLWNYGLLLPQDQPQLPMMGVQVAREVCGRFRDRLLPSSPISPGYRFKKHETKTDDFRYQVMRKAGVADLGGSAALRQAYLIYLITLLSLYVAMTFFGKLIVQTLNALNVVGIQVDSSSLQFDSPQWPLTLAFGFAGLRRLFRRFEAAEGMAVPARLSGRRHPGADHQTAGNLIDILDAAAATAYRSLVSKRPGRLPEAQELSREMERKLAADRKEMQRTWVFRSLEKRPAKLESLLTLLAQLEILVEWARGKRGAWPGSEVSDKVRALEQEVAVRRKNCSTDLTSGCGKRPPEATGRMATGRPARRAPGRRSDERRS